MSRPMDLLEQLRAWFSAEADALRATGLAVEFAHPVQSLPKPSASVTVLGDSRLARLTVWETGEAELDLGDARTGSLEQQHRDITGRVGLVDAVETMIAWVRHP